MKMHTLTTEETQIKIKEWLSMCSWGDVPDYAHAIAAYMAMEGYELVKKERYDR